MAQRVFDIFVIVLAFGGIIFIHELGHFLAAKWARIRVLAFAVGMGNSVCSYRKGLGFRLGSTNSTMRTLQKDAQSDNPDIARRAQQRLASISPTEYRLNSLPFGGYVKMLGQEDLNPNAVSSEADSYQNCPAWKRLVVLSAGVVFNLVSAAALFILVFMVGRPADPPIIGTIAQGQPASITVASNATQLGLFGDAAHLQPGDRVVELNGSVPESFDDLRLASAIARAGGSVEMRVERDGVAEPIVFVVKPQRDQETKLLSMGVGPAVTTTVYEADNGNERAIWNKARTRIGFDTVEPGAQLISANGITDLPTGQSLAGVFAASDGSDVTLEFRQPSGAIATANITPRPIYQTQSVSTDTTKDSFVVDHIAGFVPVLRAIISDESTASSRGYQAGLRDGDVFARVGSVEFPSYPEGVVEIRAHSGNTVEVVVLRGDGPLLHRERITLQCPVSKDGSIGFNVGDSSNESAVVAQPLWSKSTPLVSTDAAKPVAVTADAHIPAGSTILTVNGMQVSTLDEVHREIQAAIRHDAGELPTEQPVDVALSVQYPSNANTSETPSVSTVMLHIGQQQARQIASLGWDVPFYPEAVFAPFKFKVKASSPLNAIDKGIHETRRVMVYTYLTLARLFEGTVRVEHLKGPVGIAHVGSRIVGMGIIPLLFFMALISVNLAVINFLPLPIVDGGQAIFVVIEMVTKRPVPVIVQSFATMAGIALIGTMFIVVTFNDIRNLF